MIEIIKEWCAPYYKKHKGKPKPYKKGIEENKKRLTEIELSLDEQDRWA